MTSSKQQRVGRYEIQTMLGRGAMGTVYQARDPMIDRLVAIKTISVAGAGEDAAAYRERFFREAQAAGRLSHPGIVTIYDVDEDPERGPYIVMEYVAGQTLDQMLSAGRLSFTQALELADQLAQALHCAHAQGIVHRDIKPANIIVTEEGAAKITDFGVAKLDLTQFTAKGLVFGTPSYMSPEQLEGEAVDARSDLFSLGIVLYSMLTGHRPFQGNSPATISFKLMYKDPVPVTALNAALPADVDYVVTRALAKLPGQRYQSGQEFSIDLQDVRAGNPPRSRKGDAADRVPDRTVAQAARARLKPGSQDAPLGQALGWMRSGRGMQVGLAVLAAIGIFAIWALHGAARSSGEPAAPPVMASSTAANSAGITPAPLSQPPAAVPAIEHCPVHVTVRYPFASATLALWVDDKLTYQRHLRGQAKKRMLVLKSVEGSFNGTFSAPTGEHVLRAQVSSEIDGFQRTETLRADFHKDPLMTLLIDVHGRDRELAVSLTHNRTEGGSARVSP